MQTFKKEERLCSKKTINILLKQGTSFNIPPFKVIWLKIDELEQIKDFKNKYPAQVLISVSKRNFHKAVDRNKIKRLIREAYRKNKTLLYKSLNEKNKKCAFMILYIENDIMPYNEIESKILLVLQRLIYLISKR